VNFYTKVIGGFALLLAVALGVIFLFRTTDEKLIEKLLVDGLEAAERGDAEAVIALLSPVCENRERLAGRIRQAVGQRISPARLAGSAIQVSGDDADASARVVIGALQFRKEFGLRFKLKKEAGAWKITFAEEAP
jgi:hypothetical protein